MGNDQTKEEYTRYRTDTIQRAQETKERIRREEEQIDRLNEAKNQLEDRIMGQERHYMELLKEGTKDKDKMLAAVREHYEENEKRKDEDIKMAYEKVQQQNEEHYKRIMSVGKNYEENLRKVMKENETLIQKKDKELKDATDRMLQIKKEGEERTEKMLAEKQRWFEADRSQLMNNVQKKDDTLKESYDKIINIQKEGIENTEKMRSQLKEEKKDMALNFEEKLSQKELQIKQMNEQTFEMQRQADKRLEEVMQRDQEALNTALDRQEERHKDEISTLTNVYDKAIDVTINSNAQTHLMLQQQIEALRITSENSLKIKDEVNRETQKRIEVMSEANKQVRDMYERMLQMQQSTMAMRYYPAIEPHPGMNFQPLTCTNPPQYQMPSQQVMLSLPGAQPFFNNVPMNHPNQPAPSRLSEEHRREKHLKTVDVETQQASTPNRPPSVDEPVVEELETREVAQEEEVKVDETNTTGNSDIDFDHVSAIMKELCRNIVDRTDSIVEKQLEDVKLLQEAFNGLTEKGIDQEVLPGEDFWQLIFAELERHRHECQTIFITTLRKFGEIAKGHLNECVTRHEANAYGGLQLEELGQILERGKDETWNLYKILRDDLDEAVFKYIISIQELNEDLKCWLLATDVGDAQSSSGYEQLKNDIKMKSATYAKYLKERIEICQTMAMNILNNKCQAFVENVREACDKFGSETPKQP